MTDPIPATSSDKSLPFCGAALHKARGKIRESLAWIKDMRRRHAELFGPCDCKFCEFTLSAAPADPVEGMIFCREALIIHGKEFG